MTKYGWTGVEIAAINGHYNIVKLLVQGHGANVNWVNPHNLYTPLENAIEGGHLHTVRQYGLIDQLDLQSIGSSPDLQS